MDRRAYWSPPVAWRSANRLETPGETAFTLAMGRRRNQSGPVPQTSPFYFDPQVTGYALHAGKHAIHSAGGDLMLYADTAGEWEGTPRENPLQFVRRCSGRRWSW